MKVARKTLFGVLRHIIFWSVALTLSVSSLMFAAVFFRTVSAQHQDNMLLVARATAYTAEAAVMFGDNQAAVELLDEILTREALCRITIHTDTNPGNAVFAQVANPCGDTDDSVTENVSHLFSFNDTVRTDIIGRDGQTLGIVEIKSNDSVFVSFWHHGLVVFVLCLVLAVLVARVPARWMEQRFAVELSALSGMAHAARLEGDFTRRLPTFEIAEFNGLGEDFNALFGELQARNAELMLKQSQLEAFNKTLYNMTLCDALTGLANRACFSEQLENAIKAARSGNSKVGILYVDNDHFKDINDKYGHSAGDALLLDVGKRLSGAVRESDLVARLGGDEFAILLAPVGGEDDLRHVANKVLAAMSRKLRLSERVEVDIELGVSIGMSLFPDQASDALSLLRAADHAMYRAKRLGRGRACMYDPAVDVHLEDS